MAENIHKGHRQRIRQKFMKTGFTAFADHEKLELLLFYAIPMKDTNPIAHNLLNRFKSIGGVFDATYEQLMEVDGISESTAVFLKLVPEMAKEYMLSENIHVCMDSTEAVCNFFSTQFIGDVNEKIKIACVDDR